MATDKGATMTQPKKVQPAAPQSSAPSPVDRARKYLGEVMSELRKTTWPSKEETRVQTEVVLLLLVVVGVYIFAWDSILGFLFRGILQFMGVRVTQ